MFRRILVPLDGSREAEGAIPFAGLLARSSGGTVLILRLAQGGQPEVVISDGTERDPDVQSLEQRGTLAGVPVEWGAGRETQAITAAAREWRADLIVLRSGGHAGARGRILSEAPADIVRQSPVPVLLLRAGDWASVSADGNVRTFCPGALRFLVPLDGSELAETAIGPALQLMAALAGTSTCVLHLVRVIDVDSRWRMAARYLDEVAARIRRESAALCSSLVVTWSVIAHVDVAEALERIAEVGEDEAAHESWSVARDMLPIPAHPVAGQTAGGFERCDFLAMTTRGHSGLRRWALGSTVQSVLSRTELPVLAVRAGLPEARPEDDDLAADRWRTRPLAR